MASKATEIHSMTLKIEGDTKKFQETYNKIFIEKSQSMKIIPEVKPSQVILDTITGCCTIYILRNPKIPAYKFNDYIFEMAGELKAEYDLSSVILKRKVTYVDPDNVPEFIELNPKDAEEIVKRAMEDDMFSDKYKEHISRKTKEQLQKERDDRDAAAAEAFAARLSGKVPTPISSMKVVIEGNNQEDIVLEKEAAEQEAEAEIASFSFKMENNGQLCLVF